MSLPVLHSLRNHNEMARRSTQSRSTTSDTRSLNFNQAMADFRVMFPNTDSEVILTVLRANNGVVQTTIDQLLLISENSTEASRGEDVEDGITSPDLPSYADHYGSLPNEPPPAYTECDPGSSRLSLLGACGGASSTDSPAAELASNLSHTSRFWRPQLVCNLSDDFLRLTPNLRSSSGSANRQPSSVTDSLSSADGFETDQQLERYLEDERLAMFLQNEEFVRQLRHNPEFVDAVEADHRNFVTARSDPSDHVTNPDGNLSSATTNDHQNNPSRSRVDISNDDAAFSLKLKHMGKSTRKRFGKLAKRFSRTKRNGKSVGHPTESRFNLLEEEDDTHEAGGIDGYCHSDQASIDNSYGSESEASVDSPRGGAVRCVVNNEPIVFYGEDNEFELKRDGSET